MLFRTVSAALWMLAAGAGLAAAQDSLGGPAELPPESFRGPQYVDSRGCVFLRAGYGGTVNWVPRVTRERKPLCGYPPSFAPEPAATVSAVPQPEPSDAPAPAQDAAPAAPSPAEPELQVQPAAAPAPAAPAPQPPQAAAPKAPAVVQAAAAAALRAQLEPGRSARKARPSQPKAHRKAPVMVVRPADANEAFALARLTLRHNEVRAAGDMPDRIGCPGAAPAPRRVATADGGSTVLCTQPGRGLAGARVPVLSARDMDLLAGRPLAAEDGKTAGRHYVQVGAFLQAPNAARARARLATLGLPVSVAEGGALEIVLAGPFGDPAAARAALRSTRGAGFHDAFIR